MIQNYINHVCLVLDKSGSMGGKEHEVIRVFDNQIKYLAQRSRELEQETRVSVYLFSGYNQIECIIYDKDVLRLPSIKNYYKVSGQTALIDATLKSIEDLQKTPELYGDHAFLLYALTDGFENNSRNRSDKLESAIKTLPENWTVACLVPDQKGVFEAKKFGFPAQNIQVWSTENSNGVEEVGEVIKRATETFMQGRTSGVRGTKNLFNLDASNLSKTTIARALEQLKPAQYDLFPVQKDIDIKKFVESWTGSYLKGSAYYQLMKTETIQGYKQICIYEKQTGKVYSGLNARKLLSLPDFDVKVNPQIYGNFEIYVQSTSSNRKLIKGTKLIVLK